MIILDGADGVGKTTLAKALAKALNIKVRHMTKPDDDFDHVAGYLRLIGSHVQDRFHLGSVVYGKLLGQGPHATPGQMRIVQRYLRWFGCITVVMHCQRAELKRRLLENPKREMYSNEQILTVNDGYRALLGCSNRGEPWHDVAIDVTDDWPDVDDEPVQRIIERWESVWR